MNSHIRHPLLQFSWRRFCINEFVELEFDKLVGAKSHSKIPVSS